MVKLCDRRLFWGKLNPEQYLICALASFREKFLVEAHAAYGAYGSHLWGVWVGGVVCTTEYLI